MSYEWLDEIIKIIINYYLLSFDLWKILVYMFKLKNKLLIYIYQKWDDHDKCGKIKRLAYLKKKSVDWRNLCVTNE